MAPKALLRDPRAKSDLVEFDDKADDVVSFKGLMMIGPTLFRACSAWCNDKADNVVCCSGRFRDHGSQASSCFCVCLAQCDDKAGNGGCDE